MRLLLLYTELADYTLACLRALKELDEDHEIHVVHYPVNPEAPFKLDTERIGNFRSLDEFSSYEQLKRYVSSIGPEIIVCSGWVNKWYVRACRSMRGKSTTIVCSDNQWHGTLKQHLLSAAAPLTLKKIFNKIWIPGEPQKSFAEKIGYSASDILTGFYSCDVPRFTSLFDSTFPIKANNFPRRFLCVARYIPAKGYQALWNAFIKWKSVSQNNWELWCAGTGQEFDKRVKHESIRHLGFVQPEDWHNVVSQTGVFILPSLYEPWGVVVHEFAAAGYPLLLSKQVGAADALLTVDNGISFDPANEEEIISCFERIALKDDAELMNMAKSSVNAALKITPESWCRTLLNSLN